jgi:hypothetical protein
MATNATSLFEYPFKKAHSEPYWTSLLAVFLVRIAQQRTVEPLSTWRLRLGGPGWKWKYERSTSLMVAGLTWEDILVEPNLQEFVRHVFKKRFPDRAVIVPDLVIREKDRETDVTLVEVKTAGAKLADYDVKKYSDALDALRGLDIKPRLLLLCSLGHDRPDIPPERLIEAQSLPAVQLELLLWEELLRSMAEDQVLGQLLPPNVLDFTEMKLEG